MNKRLTGDMVENINIIVAVSENNCIGVEGKLPWKLPTDLKRFKEITTGHVVVMGRKTWESLPEKVRPLPNRINVVITRNKDYVAKGAEVRTNLESALEEFVFEDTNVFVIGGAEIYKEAFKYANILHLTRVVADVEGDTFLEGLEPSEWYVKGFEGPYNEGDFDYRFETYMKKQ